MGIETSEFAIDTLQDFSLHYADIIIANDSDNPNNTDLYKQALAKNDLTAIATSSTTHPQNLAPNIIVLTRTNALILLTDKDQRQSSALDKMQLLANAGSHIIMSGQNLLENNANLVSETEPFSHSFFSDLNIQFAGNYEIAGFADPMHGFAANPIGNDLSLTIRLTNQESPDILSSNNDSVLKAFYYGDTAIDTLNIAGVSVSNTGKGGKAVILGFDLHYQSPALLSEILKRSIDYFDGVINSIGKTFVTSPKDYELYQNYPNPFNPQTNIKFYLPTADKVKLQVYDISGRKIKTLISNMEMVPGWHLTQWNGKTETGYDAASGVYFYTLDGNHFSQSRKMLLIR